MPIRIGVLSLEHMHAWGYIGALKGRSDAVLVGAWDNDSERLDAFGKNTGAKTFGSIDALLSEVDAVVVTSANKRHAELGEQAASKGKHILCEKPLVTTEEEGQRLLGAVDKAGVKLMTAFPCRYSPAFRRLVERVDSGEIGQVRAIAATNRGTCPFGWFVEPEKSGGGSLIDHVVHVADLLRAMLRKEPKRVNAQIGNNVYGQKWEDTAMLTIEFDDGIFATLDSSWSRPPTFKTWGDVTMNVVGESGVLEMDMFGQEAQVYRAGSSTHTTAGFGASLDDGLLGNFIDCIVRDVAPPIDGRDGLAAARVAMAGYRSVAQCATVDV